MPDMEVNELQTKHTHQITHSFIRVFLTEISCTRQQKNIYFYALFEFLTHRTYEYGELF